jgi:hypothetical protein
MQMLHLSKALRLGIVLYEEIETNENRDVEDHFT